MEHLIYCDAKEKVLDKLLDGSKTMIIRGAAARKLPHGRVFKDENVYFIENNGSGIIVAKAVVMSVVNTEKLTHDESIAMVDKYQDKLNLSKKQYDRWAGKKCLCLVEVRNVEKIEPLVFNRQSNMDDWITVECIDSIIEGSSKKYNSIRL